jgi:type IV pili sensor histidine kinase/response regulator
MASFSLTAQVSTPPSTLTTTVMQIARYSVLQPSPTLEQQDLLAVAAPLRVPEEIATVGGAVEWVLNLSGYRVVSSDQLSVEVKDLLNQPLPNAHRRFVALPKIDVITLLVGPTFVLVHDPVHRLMSFEGCGDSAAADSQSPANRIKTPKSN